MVAHFGTKMGVEVRRSAWLKLKKREIYALGANVISMCDPLSNAVKGLSGEGQSTPI